MARTNSGRTAATTEDLSFTTVARTASGIGLPTVKVRPPDDYTGGRGDCVTTPDGEGTHQAWDSDAPTTLATTTTDFNNY